MVADETFNLFEDRINKELSLIEDKISKQEYQYDRQIELAKAGAENTLAFEQAELARLEAEKKIGGKLFRYDSQEAKDIHQGLIRRVKKNFHVEI